MAAGTRTVGKKKIKIRWKRVLPMYLLALPGIIYMICNNYIPMFGITIAFALACMALCWMILNDSSNLMNSKADVTLGDYIGMTKEQAMATDQIASGQISPEWEEEYNSNYAAGYIYKQSPVSGRTVREGQSVTLTVTWAPSMSPCRT